MRVKNGMAAKKNKAAAEGITVTYEAKQVVKLTTKKSISAKEIILKHSKDFNRTLNDNACSKVAGISRNTFYKYKAELRAIKLSVLNK